MLFLVVILSATALGATAQSPILIIPGFIGSQLEARVTSDPFSCTCCTNGIYERVWVNQAFASMQPLCLVNDLILLYNSSDDTYTNNTGAEVRVPGFGNTNTVEYLDTPPAIPYFNTFVDYFVARGYERGNTIRAAPYDWRLAADGLYRTGYYSRVQQLIETMYNSSGGEKVTLVVHSMGGIVSLYFLNEVVSQEWKARYINAWVTISGAWPGGNSILQTVISDPLQLLYRSTESSAWQLPNPSIWGDTILVTSPNRTYTANDYEDLFTDVGYPQMYQMYLGIVSINENYTAPRVPIHCMYGVNVSTRESFTYGNGFGANPTNTTFSDGDGTINLLTSQVCLKWRNEQSEPFSNTTYPGVNHFQMVADTAVLEAVAEVIRAPTPSPSTMSPTPSSTAESPTPSSTAMSVTVNLLIVVGSTVTIFALKF